MTAVLTGALSTGTYAATWTVDDDGADKPDADFASIQDAVGQMACVASTRHIAGDHSWTVILDKLNDTARQLTIATP